MPTLNPWSRSSKLPQPDLTMFIKWNGVTVISDPTQWLPTPQHLKQNLSLSAFEWVHLPDCSLRWSAVKYWVLSYRAIIVMLHVWQWNWYELKSSGYIFKYFPVGLIAHKWKARVCVLLLGVNTSVCVHVVYFVIAILNSGVLVTCCLLQSHKRTAASQLTLASLCEIYSRETLVEWKKGCHC